MTKIKCPHHPKHGMRPEFVFDEDGLCDKCRTEARRAEQSGKPALTWNDIRAKRNKLIAATDWTQLPDVPEAVRSAYQAYRQELRDVTDAASPDQVVWPVKPT